MKLKELSGTVIQKNHYYPFGTAFAEKFDNGSNQPYKYNGKELDDLHEVNLYDYSARYYESAVGRFTSVDPLAEKYYSISPYAYCANNPIKFIDPDGRDWIDRVAGVVMGIATNTVPASTGLRNLYTPNNASDYNNTLRGADAAALVVGTVAIIVGIGEMTAGGGTAAVGGGMSATGVGAPVGGIVAGVGGVVATKGAAQQLLVEEF